MDLGDLILSLKLDRTTFDRQMSALSMENFKDLTISIGFNPTSTISTVRKNLDSLQSHLDKNPLMVRVNHKPLEELNKHLELKKKHLKEVVAYFNNNPIKPKLDSSGLNLNLENSKPRVKSVVQPARVQEESQSLGADLKSIRTILEEIKTILSFGKVLSDLSKENNEISKENRKATKQAASNTAFSPIRLVGENIINKLASGGLSNKLLNSVKKTLFGDLDFFIEGLFEEVEESFNAGIKKIKRELTAEILTLFDIKIDGRNAVNIVEELINAAFGADTFSKTQQRAERKYAVKAAKANQEKGKERELLFENYGAVNRDFLKRNAVNTEESREQELVTFKREAIAKTNYLNDLFKTLFAGSSISTEDKDLLAASRKESLKLESLTDSDKILSTLNSLNEINDKIGQQLQRVLKDLAQDLKEIADLSGENKFSSLAPEDRASTEKKLIKKRDEVVGLKKSFDYEQQIALTERALISTQRQQSQKAIQDLNDQSKRIEAIFGIPAKALESAIELGIKIKDLPEFVAQKNLKSKKTTGNEALGAYDPTFDRITYNPNTKLSDTILHHELVHKKQLGNPYSQIKNEPLSKNYDITAQENEFLANSLKPYTQASDIPLELEAYLLQYRKYKAESEKKQVLKTKEILNKVFGNIGSELNPEKATSLNNIINSSLGTISYGMGYADFISQSSGIKKKATETKQKLSELQSQYQSAYQNLSVEGAKELLSETQKALKALDVIEELQSTLKGKIVSQLKYDNNTLDEVLQEASRKKIFEEKKEKYASFIDPEDFWFSPPPQQQVSKESLQSSVKPEKVDLKTIASLLKAIEVILKTGNSLSGKTNDSLSIVTNAIDSIGSILLGAKPSSSFATPFASPYVAPPVIEKEETEQTTSIVLASQSNPTAIELVANQAKGQLAYWTAAFDDELTQAKGQLAYWTAAFDDELTQAKGQLAYWAAAINEEFKVSEVFGGIKKFASNETVQRLALAGITSLGQASLSAARETYTLARVTEEIALTLIPFGHGIKKGVQMALPYAVVGAGTMALGGAGGLLEAGTMAHGFLAPAIEGAGALASGAASGLGVHGMEAFLLEKAVSLGTAGVEAATYALPAVTGAQVIKKVAEQTIGKAEKALGSDKPLPQLLPAATLERLNGSKKALQSVSNLLQEAKSLEKVNPQRALLLTSQARDTIKKLAPALDKEIESTPPEDRTNSPFSRLKASLVKQSKSLETITNNASKLVNKIGNLSKNLSIDTPTLWMSADQQKFVDAKNRMQSRNKEIAASYKRGDVGAGQSNTELIDQVEKMLSELDKTVFSKEQQKRIKGVKGDLTRTAKQILKAAKERESIFNSADIGINLESAGKSIVEGLKLGIESSIPDAEKSVIKLAQDINEQFEKEQGIHSPSDNWLEYGLNLVKGLILGLGKGFKIGVDFAKDVNKGLGSVKLALAKEKLKESITYKASDIKDKAKQFATEISEKKEYAITKILTFKVDTKPITANVDALAGKIFNSSLIKNLSDKLANVQKIKNKIIEEIDYLAVKGGKKTKESIEYLQYRKPRDKTRILPDPLTDPDLTDSVIQTEKALYSYEMEVLKLESKVKAKTEGKKIGTKVLEILKDVVIVGFGVKAIGGLISGTFGILGETIQSQLLDLRTLISKGIDFQQLKLKLSFITPEGQTPKEYLESLKNTANSSGVDLFQYSTNVVAFDRATLNTSLSGQSQEIYGRFSKGLAGLPKESQQNALTAITQMASKGRVSLEELNGQLSEAMPGALSSAAKAMGVTNAELINMVSNGEVLSEDLLPKLAQQLEIESLPKLAGSIGSGSAALNELNNEFTIFQGKLGEVALSTSKPVLAALTDSLEFLNKDLGSLINLAIAASAVLTSYLAQSFLRLSGLIDKTTGSFIGFVKGGELLKTAVIGLTKQLLIVGVLFSGIKVAESFLNVKGGTSEVNSNLKTLRESLKLTQQEYAKTSKAANEFLGEKRFREGSQVEKVLSEQRPKTPISDQGQIIDWLFDEYKGQERPKNRDARERVTFGEQQQIVETELTSKFLDLSQAQIEDTFNTIIANPQNIDKTIENIQSLNEQIATLQAEKKTLRIINPEDGNAALELDKKIQSLRGNLYNIQNSLMPGGEAAANLVIQQLQERRAKLSQQRDEQGFFSPAITTQIQTIDTQISLVNRGLEKSRDISAEIGTNFKNLGLINAQLQRDLATGLSKSTKESIEAKITNYDRLTGANLNTANQQTEINKVRAELNTQRELETRYTRAIGENIDDSKRQPIEMLTGKKLEELGTADLDYARSQLGEDYDTVLKLLEARVKIKTEIGETRLTLAQLLNEFANTVSENKARLLTLNVDRISSSFVGDRRKIDLQQQSGLGGQLAATFFERLKLSINQKEANLIKQRIGAGSPFVTEDIRQNTGIAVDDVRKLNLEQIDFLSKVDQLKPETKAVISNLQKVVSLNQENEQLSLTIARQTYRGLDTIARQLAELQLKTSIGSFSNQIKNLNNPTLNSDLFSGTQGLRSTTRESSQELITQKQAFEDFVRSIQDLIFTLNTQIAQTQEDLIKSFRSIEIDRIGGDIAAITALGFNGIVSQIGSRIQELFSEASQLLSSDTRPQLKRDLAQTQREYEKQLIDFNRQSLSLNTSVENSIFQRQQSNRETEKSRLELDQRSSMSIDELKSTALSLRQQQIEYNRAAAEAETLAVQSNIKIAIPRSTSLIPTDFEIESAGTESWRKMQSIYAEQIALNNNFISSMQQIQSEGNSQIESEKATYQQLHREFVALKEEQIVAEGQRIEVATDNLGKKIKAVVTGFTATLTDALISANRQLEDFKFSNIEFLNQFKPLPFDEKYKDVDRTVRKQFGDQRRSQEDYSRQLDRFITESQGETSIDSLVNKIAGSDAIAPELRDKFVKELNGAKTLEELNAIVERYKSIKKEVDRMIGEELSSEQEQKAIDYQRFKLNRQFNLNYLQNSSSLNTDIYGEYLNGNKNTVNPFDRAGIQQIQQEQQWNAEFLNRQEGYYQQYESGQIDLSTLTLFLTELERLNKFKLENIRQEFDLLGKTIEDTFSESFQKGLNEFILGKTTITEFLDSIVQSFAQAFSQIASSWVSSQISNLLFGGTQTELNPVATNQQSNSSPFSGILGGLIGLFNGGGQSDKPLEIQNFLDGGEASALGLGVLKAMRREGVNAVPIVVSKGEQILSTNNGDAQFFRTLQSSGQWLRLKQNNYLVNNYKYGGVAGNSLDSSSKSNSSSTLKDKARAGNNITINVNTPNADSFRKAQGQIRRDTFFELRRNEKRNG